MQLTLYTVQAGTKKIKINSGFLQAKTAISLLGKP